MTKIPINANEKRTGTIFMLLQSTEAAKMLRRFVLAS